MNSIILRLRANWRSFFIFIFLGVINLTSSLPKFPDQAFPITGESLEFELQAPTYQVQHIGDGTTTIQAEGFPANDHPGELALPRQVVQVALPPDADPNSLNLELISVDLEQFPGRHNIPRNPPDSNSETQKTASSLLDQDAPGGYVRLLSTGQMRKWRFANLAFTPFRLDGATEQLYVAKKVHFRLNYSQLDSSQDSAFLNDTVMDDLAEQMFLNFDQAQAWYPPSDSPNLPGISYSYVIITTNDIETNSDKLDDFITHKQNMGFSVLTVTEDDYGILTSQAPDGTAEKIRKWLQDHYTTYSIEYVLLIGDPDPDVPGQSDSVGDIPMKMCFPKIGYNSPTDYFYADLTGNWNLDGDGEFGETSGDFGTGGVDFAPEVFVGRIPVYNNDYTTLDNILQKTINYENESNPFGWRRSSLLPMSFSEAGYDGAPLAEQMMDDYLDGASFTHWTQYQQGDGACGVVSTYSSDQNLRGGTVVRDRWAGNDYGLVVWWGHGSETLAMVGYTGCDDGTLFQSSYASSLDDAHPSFIYQNSCTNGYPENTGNLQYSLLKQGAVATVGATRVSWYNIGVGYGDFGRSTTNSGIGYEYARRLVEGQSASQALYNAKSSMDTEGSDTRVMNYYDFNLYGDPAIFLLPLLPPTNLNVTTISQDRIDLTWTDNSITESGFKIERSEDGTTGWTHIATVGPDETWYPSSALSCGTTYYFRVRAYNSWTNSLYSNVDSDTTWVCPPGAFNKTFPTANATGVSINPTLYWEASSDAYYYEVCVDTVLNSICDDVWNYVDPGMTNINLYGLVAYNSYEWQVRAVNTSGTTYANNGPWWKFTTAPSLPGNFNKINPNNNATSISLSPDLTWGTSSEATDYDYCIDKTNDNACTAPATWTNVGNVTGVSLGNLDPSTNYYWQVRANNNIGSTYANVNTWWLFTTGSAFDVYLPLLMKNTSGDSSTLVNGNFEQGSSVGWEIYSYNGWPVIMSTVGGFPFSPHDGNWAAWLGRSDGETTYLRQDVTIAPGDSTLHLWYQIDSEDICGYDFGHVLVDGNYEHTWNLCSTNNTSDWVELSLDLGAHANQTVTLEILTTTDYIYLSNLYVDDISF